jgi:hypothetical protein
MLTSNLRNLTKYVASYALFILRLCFCYHGNPFDNDRLSCTQGEAIAHNLRSMFGLKVPVISIVIGEGGSGGALAIGCANKLLMLENAVFYVAR